MILAPTSTVLAADVTSTAGRTVVTSGKVSNSEGTLNADFYITKIDSKGKKTNLTTKQTTSIWDNLTNWLTNRKRGTTYLKAGDKLQVSVVYDKAILQGTTTADLPERYRPTLTIKGTNGKKIEMNCDAIETNTDTLYNPYIAWLSNWQTQIDYSYTVKAGEDMITSGFELTHKMGTYAKSQTSVLSTTINDLDELPIKVNYSYVCFDTVAPSVVLTNATEIKNEARYCAGEKLTFKVTSTEGLSAATAPEVQVNFGESGVGKKNYTDGNTSKKGYAQYVSETVDSTTNQYTWTYSYEVTDGDEGYLSTEFKSGSMTDLAGNVIKFVDIKEIATQAGDKVDSIIDWNQNLGVTCELYKTRVSEENRIDSAQTTYIAPTDKLIVKATFDKVLYSIAGGSPYVKRITADRLPNLYLNGMLDLPNTGVTLEEQDNATVATYTFDMTKYSSDVQVKGLTALNKLVFQNSKNTAQVDSLALYPLGNIPFSESYIANYNAEEDSILQADALLETTVNNLFLSTGKEDDNKTINDLYADTTSPVVTITARRADNNQVITGVTNAEVVRYTFEWSEKLATKAGDTFETDDIMVTNGIKGSLLQDATDPRIYTMDVTTTNSDGAMTLSIPSERVKDIAGQTNTEVQISVTVDKTAPTLQTLEATTEETDNPKTPKILIIATFSEKLSQEVVPQIGFKFSNSGNKKGEDPSVTITGNQVMYTYQSTEADDGTLSVTSFTGFVQDQAGNQTRVANRTLSGTVTLERLAAPTVEFNDPNGGAYQIGVNDTQVTITPSVTINDTVTSLKYRIVNANGTQTEYATITPKKTTVNLPFNVTQPGQYTVEVVVVNEEEVEATETSNTYTVTKEEKVEAEIVFNTFETGTKEGIKYVKVSPKTTTNAMTRDMNSGKLAGQTPEYTDLTVSDGLKTGTKIKLDGETEYIVVVKGDVNCDGGVDFINDIVMLNNYRLGRASLSTIQVLAGDLNGNTSIDFLNDIVAMNNYRLNRTSSL